MDEPTRDQLLLADAYVEMVWPKLRQTHTDLAPEHARQRAALLTERARNITSEWEAGRCRAHAKTYLALADQRRRRAG